MTKGEKEKADVLAEFFSSVFTEEPSGPLPQLPHRNIESRFSMEITPEVISKKLRNLNISKSPGPDGFHPKVLRELSDILNIPLSIIFTKSLNTGKLPDIWKTANVTAIYKKGDKTVAGNYRPVSLTCICCKVLESIIRDSMMDHLLNNKLISDKQFGFVPKRSTVLQLLHVLDEWTETLDNGGSVDVVYCDFLKAFDKVPHLRLLNKLHTYGLPDYLVDWIRGFLLGRRQRVAIQGALSDWKSVLSGIPQGSVLGPLLFVLYINCLPNQIQHGSSVYLFADDTKLFKHIQTVEDCQHLQTDINHIVSWTEDSLLKLHPDKCKLMRICSKNSQIPAFDYTLGSTGNSITRVSEEKDLGVTIDDKLSFDQHINEKINTANRVLGTIRRNFSYIGIDNFSQLYKALVHPHLEFANQIWAPHLKKHTEALENVQRQATKMLPELRDLSYPDRLCRLKLPTLAYRRLRGDMIELYKILSGKYDPDVSNNQLHPTLRSQGQHPRTSSKNQENQTKNKLT